MRDQVELDPRNRIAAATTLTGVFGGIACKAGILIGEWWFVGSLLMGLAWAGLVRKWSYKVRLPLFLALVLAAAACTLATPVYVPVFYSSLAMVIVFASFAEFLANDVAKATITLAKALDFSHL